MRSVARATGTDKDTVSRILVEVGEFCSTYCDVALRDLGCSRIEADEIWSFVGAKAANAKRDGQGDLWTYVALCADSKLAVTWLVGPRSADTTRSFMCDLAGRLSNRVQLSTDALHFYRPAVEAAFGWAGCDWGIITKQYAGNPDIRGRGRYSPSPVVVGVEKETMMGQPDHGLISTSYVERNNLTIRMQMRRMTRLTNAFSKKAENHAAATDLHFMHYNFCRPHLTLTKKHRGIKTTPAMEAGVTDRVWSVEDILSRMEPTYAIAV